MDPVKLEIYKSMYASVAEEMGTVMRRTAFSPNIKERRDYSCAVFDRRGQLIAQGRSYACASRFDADVGERGSCCPNG